MGIITTIEAKCRDCYRCVRSCPVKAIKIKSGEREQVHAKVLDEYCILDGRCVLECPQNAKKVESNLGEVKEALRDDTPVAASVAPSFAAGLPVENPYLVPGILKKLGFNIVQETAVGAELVSKEFKKAGGSGPLISSACPVIINLIEKHYPELIPYLSKLVSPMIAHGRYIKENYDNIPVVFIGPCIAKNGEAAEPEVSDAVDYVLRFDELWSWIQEKDIQSDSVKETEFDGPHPDLARLYPVEGGMLKTSGMETDMLGSEKIAVTGLEKCMEFLKHLKNSSMDHGVIELMACSGGCIEGPGIAENKNTYNRRQRVIDYFNSTRRNGEVNIDLKVDLLYRSYEDKKVRIKEPDEEEIREILAKTGKYSREDELNCGACGYNTCRDKAIAVYRGIAEVQMCIPYMRRRAESMSGLVLNSMPNGVIITNYKYKILELNPRAEKMFNCKAGEVIGTSLDNLIDPRNFELALEKNQIINALSNHEDYGIITREIVFPLAKEQLIAGILVDITEEQRHREQFDHMKKQTIERAQEVINKQMKVAQEIAGLLGETTAETKVLLSKLVEIMQEPTESDERGPEEK